MLSRAQRFGLAGGSLYGGHDIRSKSISHELQFHDNSQTTVSEAGSAQAPRPPRRSASLDSSGCPG